MPLFSPNDEVELIRNPAVRGFVDRILPISNGIQFYRILYTEGSTGMHVLPESDIQAVQGSLNPWDNLAKGRFYTYRDYQLNAILHKIENTVENTISGLKASKTLFKPHQFIPLVKFLRSENRRILIADEVGLGKTIEAGHILLELFARREINRVLVVCTKTLREKWRDEMHEKFAFQFDLIKSNDLINAFSGNVPPEQYFGVITYNSFSTNKKLADLTKQHRLPFDLIILDEVQMIRNHKTKMYKALDPLIQDAGATVFLSATPINNKLEDLYNLLRLLDPRRYLDSRNFENDQAVNRPIVKALNRLAALDPLVEIARDLREAQIERQFEYGEISRRVMVPLTEMMAGVPLFDRVLKRLESDDSSRNNRVLIQRDMADLNTMSNLLTRTRKRDVEERSPIRRPIKIPVIYSDQEREEFERVTEELLDLYNRENEHGEVSNSSLPFLTGSRMLASSLHASQRIDPRQLHDSKYHAFKKVIQEVVAKSGRKLVVFAEFKRTLHYLNDRLKADGFNPVLITGENPKDRPALLNQFREDPDVHILLASRVGTEGIDLQFCDALVNYDLPWNPMIVEQRIGRLDRIGQKSEKIYLYNLVTTDTIEEEVYDLLLFKIKIFESSIGSLEVILDPDTSDGANLEKLERDLYGKRLSKEERIRLIDQRATALINQRENLQIIEKELTDAMVQDMYFRNEIDRIVRNERYLTAMDIRLFVEHFLEKSFPEINFPREPGSSPTSITISVPRPAANRLIDVIRTSIDGTDPAHKNQLNLLFKGFLAAMLGEGPISLEFDQEVAFNHPNRLFVSAFHPLVYAATRQFNAQGIHRYNAFCLGLNHQNLGQDVLNVGSYALVVAEIEVTRNWKSKSKTHRTAHPIALSLTQDGFNVLDQETSDRIWKESHRASKNFPLNGQLPTSVVDAIHDAFHLRLFQCREEVLSEETIRLESARQQELKRLEEHFNWQIESRKQALHEMEVRLRQLSDISPSKEAQGYRLGALNLRNEIAKLESDYESRKAAAIDSHIAVSMKTMTVCLLEVQ